MSPKHSSNTKEIVNKLQSTIREKISPLFDTSKPYALVDFPNYLNVGDNAIWLGEVAYFDDVYGRKPDYVSDLAYFMVDELRASMPQGGTIFIHGGGNFGDLWPAHQGFREKILNEFKDYKIIQLPQSIHFSDQEQLKKSQSFINNHDDFTLLVRDRKSLEIAQKNYTCATLLVPDMACYMGLLPRVGKEKHDVFCLLRTDHEKKSDDPISEAALEKTNLDIKIDDWISEDSDVHAEVKKETIKIAPFVLGVAAFKKFRRRELFYTRLAQRRLKRGVEMLCSGKYVITDRLHAHILSFLLDIPHTRLDNFYGKVSGFANEWVHESNIIKPADTFETALDEIPNVK